MKNIWIKIKNFFKKEGIILAALLILVTGIVILYQQYRIDKLNKNYEIEVKLRNALLDSVTFYQNIHKELVAEKLSIQESVKNMEKIVGQLTSNQAELLKRIKEVEKNGDIIAAAVIETSVNVAGLKPGQTDVRDSSVIFSDSTKDVKYKLLVNHVVPTFKSVKPTLDFSLFKLYNKQFVEFHWKDDKKSGYPVSFSVSNSNEYFKTFNIDSYIIPEIQKNELKPNVWQKLTKWVGGKGKIGLYVGLGFAASTPFWLLK